MKKILLAFLLSCLPLLVSASGGGGFPSRPLFQSVTLPTGDTLSQFQQYKSGGTAPGISLTTTSNGAINFIATGAYRDASSNWIAGAASAVVIGTSAGVTTFNADTGLTAGNSFTPTARATLSANGTWSTTKACATNYTRMGPNYCAWSNYGASFPSFNATNACQETTALSGVTDAKGLLVRVDVSLISQNSIGQRIQTATAYADSDATCTNAGATASAFAYEHVAVAGSITIGQNSVTLPIFSTATGLFRVKTINASTIGTATYVVLGYFD